MTAIMTRESFLASLRHDTNPIHAVKYLSDSDLRQKKLYLRHGANDKEEGEGEVLRYATSKIVSARESVLASLLLGTNPIHIAKYLR